MNIPVQYRSLLAPPEPREQRYQYGRLLRETVPFSSLAAWVPAPDRDPIALIQASHQGRVENLIPIRVGRMASSPYGFLRGAAVVQAADSAALPATGIQPVVCGDSHLGNFGFYRSPEGELVMDLNDFDEAHTGSWEWDLRRLTASIHVAGRENSLSESKCTDAVIACVNAYRDEIALLAGRPLFERAFNRIDLEKLTSRELTPKLVKEIERAAAKAMKRTSDRALPKFAQESEGSLKITPEPPLTTQIPPADWDNLARALDEYLHTIPPQWARVLGGYTLVDIAQRVVGVGSVGLRAYIALLQGSTPEDVIFLQLKQARRSVLAQYVHGSKEWHAHQGQRVAEYQKALQTVSDPLLGWASVGERQYYVRQFRNMKGTVPLDRLGAKSLCDYAGIVGLLLAKGHARTHGASKIAGYLGKSDKPGQAFATFARAYADQTEADHAEFLRAIKDGRMPQPEGEMSSAFRAG